MDFSHLVGAVEIRDVWNHNLHAEFELIRSIVDDHPYIGLDTEFPGVTFKVPYPPYTNFESVVKNVNSLKVVQVGLTFMTANGTLPSFTPGTFCVWQFNFCDFNEEVDNFSPNSLTFLRNHGIDLKRFREEGAPVAEFARLLTVSGAVMNRDLRWVAYQGGLDFGFLIKALSGENVPSENADFFAKMHAYFPVFYDVRQIAGEHAYNGGLEDAARQLGIPRIGGAHQAGSDSLLACCVYLKLRNDLVGGSPVPLCRVLFGVSNVV